LALAWLFIEGHVVVQKQCIHYDQGTK